MCVMLRLTDIYVPMAHCCGGCVQDAFGRAELLFSVDQACMQSASHRLVTVLAVTLKQTSNLLCQRLNRFLIAIVHLPAALPMHVLW